jgi:hypothetical protein
VVHHVVAAQEQLAHRHDAVAVLQQELQDRGQRLRVCSAALWNRTMLPLRTFSP